MSRQIKTILISAAVAAAIIISLGMLFNHHDSHPSGITDLNGETASFSRVIDAADALLGRTFARDYLYSGDRHEYVVDHEKGYVERVCLKTSVNWDEVVKATDPTMSIEEAEETAEILFKQFLGKYMTDGSELRMDVQDGESYIIRIDEVVKGIPTGLSGPTICIAHNGEILLARFRIDETEQDADRIMTYEEALDKAIKVYQTSVENPPAHMEPSKEDKSILITTKEGGFEWQIYLSFTEQLGEITLERKAIIRLDALTGEVIQIMVSA
ncbi:MAG: hypothetical protein IJM90_00090 [Firmicutes bacterium]|nr:hypothetical protein [Bacillota bacterium]